MGLDKFSTSLHSTAVIGGNYSYYLLSRRGEIENWITTERSLGSVELSWIGRCDHYYDSTQLNWTHSQMFRITELVKTGPVELSRVVVMITAPDRTQLN